MRPTRIRDFKMKKFLCLTPALVLVFLVAGCSDPDDNTDIIDDQSIRGSAIVFTEHSLSDSELEETDEEVNVPEDWEEWGEFPEEFNDDFTSSGSFNREELTKRFNEKLADMQAQVVAGSSNDISTLTSAQIVWFNDNINTNGLECKDGTKLERSTTIQTIYYIYGVYSFDQNKDYYIIEQEISLPSGNLWSSKMREKKYNGHNYKSKDFYLSWLRTENWLTKGSSYLNNIAVSQYSPETVNNQTTYTAGISGNIGGTVGYMGGATATVSGGVSYSTSKTWSVQDINVKNYVMSNPSAKDASWEWTTMKKAESNFWMTDIDNPADLATTTARFSTSWLWIVDKPGKSDEYKINIKVRPQYTTYSLYVEWLVGHSNWKWWTWTFNHSFILTPPNRVQ